MKVKVIDKSVKRCNAFIIVSFTAFSIFLTIAIAAQLFAKYEIADYIFGYSIIFSLIFLSISIISALAKLKRKKTIIIPNLAEYLLKVNTLKKIEDIKSKTDIRYSGNYLFSLIDSNSHTEISNQDAFKIMSTTSITVVAESSEIRHIERSPKEVFDELMMMLWAAS